MSSIEAMVQKSPPKGRSSNRGAVGQVAALQAGIQTRASKLAIMIIIISLAIRVYYALTYHLNPDEGFHYLYAHQPTLHDVRLETLQPIHTYPPLYIFFLHFVLELGDSEFAMRLPTLLFGTVSLAFAFLWVRRLFGATAGLAALLILAFSPGITSLGFEARNYGLLLAAMSATLYALERAFAEQSSKWMTVAMLSLYVSILTNYMVAWICLTLGVYVVVRILLGHLTRPLVRQWALFQAGALGIYAWLYVTHIRILDVHVAGLENNFRESYFWPESESALWFIARQTVAVFRYLLEVQALSLLAALLFLGCLAWLAIGRDAKISHSRLTCLLLGMPLVLGCVLGLARLNPYGASRHSVIFQPFLAAGLGYGISYLLRGRVWLLMALGLILVPPWVVTAHRSAEYLAGADETKEKMASLIDRIKTLPKGTTLFVDHATLIELGYYLGRDVYSPYHGRNDAITKYTYDGYRILSPVWAWSLNAREFVPALNVALQKYPTQAKDLWVVDMGPDNVAKTLSKQSPKLHTPGLTWFGPRLSLFQVSN